MLCCCYRENLAHAAKSDTPLNTRSMALWYNTRVCKVVIRAKYEAAVTATLLLMYAGKAVIET